MLKWWWSIPKEDRFIVLGVLNATVLFAVSMKLNSPVPLIFFLMGASFVLAVLGLIRES